MDKDVEEQVASPAVETLEPPPPIYSLKLIRVSSFVLVTRRTNPAEAGNMDDLNAFYRKVQLHNVLLGWWGFPFGIIWTPMALYRNAKAWKKLTMLSADGLAAPGWFSDPAGRHCARYWDGSAWTELVSDVSSDTLVG